MPITEPLVVSKIRPVKPKNRLTLAFFHRVRWDIRHACIEQEYSYVDGPGFSTWLARYYMRGHFPCGWEGQNGAGRLVVY